MKRFFSASLIALSAILFFSGCGPEVEPTPPDPIDNKLSVSPTSLVFPATGGSQDLRVTTDASSFNVSASDSWVSTSKSGDVVTVIASANGSKDSRSATLTVVAGNAKAEVAVTQGGKTNRPADDPYPTADYGLADKTVFVPAEMCRAITVANQETRTFTVPINKTGNIKPEPGLKMIMNTPTALFPDGLLAEVVTVKETGGNYEVTYRLLKLE